MHATEILYMSQLRWQTSLLSYLRNCHSHRNHQQPPPWSVSSQKCHGKVLHQQKEHMLLQVEMTTFFSNEIFLVKTYLYWFLKQSSCTLNRLWYRININFICTRKQKKIVGLNLLWYSLCWVLWNLWYACAKGMDTSGDEGKQFLQIRKSTVVGKILITHVQLLYSENV